MNVQGTSSTENLLVLEKIAANDITSRANYCYALFWSLGTATGLFLYYSFMKRCRQTKGNWTWRDTVLCNYCISEFYILLFSMSSLVHRPDYMHVTNINCAVLSFVFNLACICGEFLQVLMALIFACHKDHFPLQRFTRVQDRPIAAVGVTSLLSLLLCVVLAVLREQQPLHDYTDCQLDPFDAPYTYDVVKMTIGFIFPIFLKLVLLVVWILNDPSFLSSLKDNPVYPAVTTVTFACRLFYNIVLMDRAAMKPGKPSLWKEALMTVAEFVLFSGSSICLVLVLCLHGPCRATLKETAGHLQKCCSGIGGRDANRRVMATHIEFQQTAVTDN